MPPLATSADLEQRPISQATFTVTPDIPSLSDIAELDENSTADAPAAEQTVWKMDRNLVDRAQVRRETFDATEAKQLPAAVALVISPPASRPLGHEAARSGVALDISPPARPTAAMGHPASQAKAAYDRRSVTPASRNVVSATQAATSADLATPVQPAAIRGIDRYRARSSVASRSVVSRASQSASQSSDTDRPSPTSASTGKGDAQQRLNLKKASTSGEKKSTGARKVQSGQAGSESVAPASATTVERKRVSAAHFKRPSLALSAAAKAPVSRLSLVKPIKNAAAIIHHPNPYAARNMYYDERWIEKQENGFKKWLNFVLTPPDGFECTDNDRVLLAPGKLDVAKLWSACTRDVKVPRAPTREVLSMRAYSVQRQLKRLRRDAAMLWQSPTIAPVSLFFVKELSATVF